MRSSSRALLLYFLASGTAAAVNFATRFLYDLRFSFTVSVVLAYCTGMIVNFALSKLFVFGARSSGNTLREFVKFLAVALTGLLFTTGVSVAAAWALESFTSLESRLLFAGAHACGMAAGFAANFAGHRLFSFRETGLWKRIQSR